METNIEDIVVSYKTKGKGQDVIFLHGWGQNKDSFNDAYEKISKTHKVWAIDFPGFGESSEPSYPFDVHDYNRILEKFVKSNDIKNPILMCHSFGARIALVFCSRGQTTNKIVLTGGAGLKPKRSIRYHLGVTNYKIMKLLVKTPLYSHYKDDLFSNSGSEDYKNASSMMKQVLSKVVNEDLTYTLKLIENEVLLYWGENDDATPLADGYKFERLLVSSKLIIMPNSGHYAFLENSNDFIEKTVEFIK